MTTDDSAAPLFSFTHLITSRACQCKANAGSKSLIFTTVWTLISIFVFSCTDNICIYLFVFVNLLTFELGEVTFSVLNLCAG